MRGYDPVVLQQLINGLAVGAVYSLIALGFTMVYGVLRIVNFAHGSIYMFGAFIGLTVARWFQVNLAVSLPAAMLGAAILGLVLERVAFTPLRGADPYSALLSSLGASVVLVIVAQMLWGTATQPFPTGIASRAWQFGGVTVTSMLLVILAVTFVLMALLYLWVQRTPIGAAMRATSHSVQLAQLMGIDVDQIIRLTFVVSSALAAAGGVLVSAYYDAIFPTMGYVAGLKAFTAAVVGGIGSIPGAMLGGLLLGLAENLAAAYLSSGYKDAIAFSILVLVLLFRPQGLLGRELAQKL